MVGREERGISEKLTVKSEKLWYRLRRCLLYSGCRIESGMTSGAGWRVGIPALALRAFWWNEVGTSL